MNAGAQHARSLDRVAVIIPALNEADSLTELLPALTALRPGRIIVADNGSTDATARVAADGGAVVVSEPRRGYGAACYAGMQHLEDSTDVVVFLDADLSDDPGLLPELAGPVLDDDCDLVIGTRVRALREPGSMTFAQRFGNALATRLIRWGWRYRYDDLGPFRAIRRSALDAIAMQDRAYGWTIEMQIRALELGLRIRQIPVPYRRRKAQSRSKISGTLRGSLLAGYWILTTCGKLWWTRRRRRE
ncbi:MAG: glycosyltransferase family 2 protein [bacterium]|nr:glycosyltransferase family 2 protein [bacterium]